MRAGKVDTVGRCEVRKFVCVPEFQEVSRGGQFRGYQWQFDSTRTKTIDQYLGEEMEDNMDSSNNNRRSAERLRSKILQFEKERGGSGRVRDGVSRERRVDFAPSSGPLDLAPTKSRSAR